MVIDSSGPRYKRGQWVRLTEIHPDVQEIGGGFEAIQRRAFGKPLRITRVLRDGSLEIEVYEDGSQVSHTGRYTHVICTEPDCVEPVAPLTLQARIKCKPAARKNRHIRRRFKLPRFAFRVSRKF